MSAYTTAQYTASFTDTSRNRQIQTVIYYPAEIADIGQPIPYIIFGHGWVMNHTFYTTLTDTLIDLGWVICFPRTEEGLFPSHSDFATDLSFLCGEVLTENLNSSSPLYGHLSNLAVAMGHSMGGGAAVLAVGLDNSFASLITFAAAETSPSAISGAIDVTIPSITFSGSSDTIAPPSQHQIPIYNNLASNYKSYISLNSAGHLDLYSNALLSPILTPWFQYLKTDSLTYLDSYENVLEQNSAFLTYQIEDNIVANHDNVSSADIYYLEIYPNPLENMNTYVTIKFTKLADNQNSTFELFNVRGQIVKSFRMNKNQAAFGSASYDLQGLETGLYLGVLTNGKQSIKKKITIIK
jgi:hypothetical protein